MVAQSLRRAGRKDVGAKQWLALLAGACILAALGLLGKVSTRLSTESDNISNSFETTRIGSIEMDSASGRCERFKFNNSTGRIARDQQPCDQDDSANGRGRSVLAGAAYRLSTISNAFSPK
jgi:hypothetical protein